MWGCTATGSLAFSPYLRSSRLTVERCRGLRRSLSKVDRPGAFIRKRSTSQVLIARISSPRRGWVVKSPPLRRATWRMRLSMSTCTSTRPQATETRSPWRNINRTRQRSRTSFRLPRTASKRRSNSLPERCFRSFTVLSRVSPPGEPQNPCKQGGVGFWTLDKMYLFDDSCRLEALGRSADGILVAATINL